ncbi:hypothetical protein [Desulfatitalea tepidiphila]|nr:hypothetical protein [Desulfatitalea tepidiphila]
MFLILGQPASTGKKKQGVAAHLFYRRKKKDSYRKKMHAGT